MKFLRSWLGLLALSALVFSAFGAADGGVRYNRDIRPLLADNCFQCHGPDKNQRKARLRLDQREEAIALRDGGAAVIPGDPQGSALFRLINHADASKRMPPAESGRSLEPGEIELLRRWIEQGAAYERHWSFVAPERPALPSVADPDWARHPIDRFVLRRLEAAGLVPEPEADRATLLRRLSFDLNGLPPSVEEVEAFIADRSPNALESVVDRLLHSERYGEHMAVMWLDAARYSDTNGYNNDTPRDMWNWRDWVIEAFNRNMSFDRFVTEQLAGDLLPNAEQEQRIATGFNRNHNITSEGGIIDEEYRLEYVADRVQTTATVFMGLTLSCARCHDHKFDPISQREYYEFFAFFNQVPEQGYDGRHGNAKPVLELPTTDQSETLRRFKQEQTAAQMRLKELKQEGSTRLSATERDTADYPADEEFVRLLNTPAADRTQKQQSELLQRFLSHTDADYGRLTNRVESLAAREKELRETIPTVMVMQDMMEPRDTFVLNRGEYDKPLEKVRPGVPAIFPGLPEGATADRRGLARWLTDPSHPLTARVEVNRIWRQLFGAGLVATAEDFGTQGAWPSHPELLDWLATELVENGWDPHALIRTIVTSATYRQSSRVTPEKLEKDPRNELLSRGPRFRMTAEMLRDNALAISGLLHHRLGGPPAKPYQPPGLWEEVSVADDSYSGGPYKQDQGSGLYRRSVYTYWKRTCPPPAFSILDAPEREFCTVQRSRSNTPLQALVLMNDPTYVEAARALAERMMKEGGSDAESKITFAFQRATARPPTPAELRILSDTYHRQLDRYQRADGAARLLQTGESEPDPSLDPAQLAAWTTIASMILNLDETVTRG